MVIRVGSESIKTSDSIRRLLTSSSVPKKRRIVTPSLSEFAIAMIQSVLFIINIVIGNLCIVKVRPVKSRIRKIICFFQSFAFCISFYVHISVCIIKKNARKKLFEMNSNFASLHVSRGYKSLTYTIVINFSLCLCFT